jgi:hypothetical protein
VEILTYVSAIFTIVGGVLAIIAAFQMRCSDKQAKIQTRELERLAGEQQKATTEIINVTNELKRVERSLSTRHLGAIEDYLPRVVEEIIKAEESISILCDFPAYGYFMDHDIHKEYRIAIMSKIEKGIKVNLMSLDKPCRADSNKKILSITDDNWEEWKQNEKNNGLLKALGFLRKGEDIRNLSLVNFLEALESIDQDMLNRYCKDAYKEEFNGVLPLDFWLFDGKRAVFAFSPYIGDASQHGFFTEDERLVTGFEFIKDRYRRKEFHDAKQEIN